MAIKFEVRNSTAEFLIPGYMIDKKRMENGTFMLPIENSKTRCEYCKELFE